jgi:hypothetical protein
MKVNFEEFSFICFNRVIIEIPGTSELRFDNFGCEVAILMHTKYKQHFMLRIHGDGNIETVIK